MDSQDSNVPDLASVLRTLSAYAPRPYSATHQGPQNLLATPFTQHDSPTPPVDRSTNSYYSTATSPPNPSSKAELSDPSLITTWPAALKYIMRSVAQNEGMQAKVRRLIQTQHDHERKWWEGREALLAKQKSRAEKKKKLDEVLRSVGGSVAPSFEVQSPEEDLAELENYDRKVYKALLDMSRALDGELRGLGIPFFAIRHNLVHSSSNTSTSSGKYATNTAGASEKSTISTDELVALQRRMLSLLEDLCKDS
ncbi:hypothetical protein VTO42DRAFT_7285 [Malbranchea cinnamomea]